MLIGSKEEILKRIGVALRKHRLRQNLPQNVLAERSGLSLTAVKRLENGSGATLGSFVQICRTLHQDGWIDALEPKDEVSPIALAEALKKTASEERKRAHVRAGQGR